MLTDSKASASTSESAMHRLRFQTWLRHYKKTNQITSVELARRLDVSAPLIRYYLIGKRVPRLSHVPRIAEALNVQGDDRAKLFAIFAYSKDGNRPATANQLLTDLIKIQHSQTLPDLQRENLFRELAEVYRRWNELRQDAIRWALIPIAGWQSRFMSTANTAHLLKRSIEEALKIGIRKIALVVAPGQRHALSQTKEIASVKRACRIAFAEQSDPRGAGDAVLVGGRLFRHEEAFALIIPDEFPASSCLAEMLTVFKQSRCSLLAMRQFCSGDEQIRGLLEVERKLTDRLWTIRRFTEKPGNIKKRRREVHWTIGGRFILTPQVFDALQRTPPNNITGRFELTDALARLAQTQNILGMAFQGGFKSMNHSVMRFLAKEARSFLE